MAVVSALDLDDQVAAGDRPRQMDRIHRRLGARVGEAPLGSPNRSRSMPRHLERVGRRLREVGAQATRRCTASTTSGLP